MNQGDAHVCGMGESVAKGCDSTKYMYANYARQFYNHPLPPQQVSMYAQSRVMNLERLGES